MLKENLPTITYIKENQIITKIITPFNINKINKSLNSNCSILDKLLENSVEYFIDNSFKYLYFANVNFSK